MDLGVFLKEQKEMQLKGNLYHFTQVNMAYNSNRIEGSQLTADETRYIYETKTIGLLDKEKTIKVDDIIETVNHFKVFDFMLDNYDKPLDLEMIKHFHYLIKRGTSDEAKSWFNVGDYKLLGNAVGDDMATVDPENVAKAMDELMEKYSDIEKPTVEDIIAFHYEFESIHPFQDGNGRVGRIIMFKECLKNNIMPFIIDEKHKLYYYRGLKEFTKVKGFLTDTCLSAQDDYEVAVKHFMKGLEKTKEKPKGKKR